MMLWNEVLQWIAIMTVGVLASGILYLITDIQRRLGPDTGAPVPHDGLEKGLLAPPFTTMSKRDGRSVSLADFGQTQLMITFLSPKCRPCAELVPALNEVARKYRDVSVLVVATSGTGTDYGRELTKQVTVLDDPGGHIQQAYDVNRTPLTYILDEERKVANRTVSNTLLDLEDTLAGLGRPVGSSSWGPADDDSASEDDTKKNTEKVTEDEQ